MFLIKNSKASVLSTPRSLSAAPVNTGGSAGTVSGHSTRKQRKSDKIADDFTSHSANSGIPTGLGPTSTISNNALTIDLSEMMTGFTSQLERSPIVYKLYRDIYFNDAICGSTIDLMSMMAFSSESSIGGAGLSGKVVSKFNENIERINARTLMHEASIDYLTLGAHLSSLIFSSERNMFMDVVPHSVDRATIDPLPFLSQDPVITVEFSQAVKSTLSKHPERRAQLAKMFGISVIDKIEGGKLELDPISTLYIPRRTFSDNEISSFGTSFLRRVLPIYLIEKNLYRGTLVESARRQRGILHVTMSGDDEGWKPNVSDLDFMTNLWMDADSDPLGAVIATRDGVSVEEVRNGGEFWKVTDFMDQSSAYKMRCLGVSEGFLNGDASFDTASQGLVVFIELLRSYRDMMTRKIFYNKLFPTISLVNGYTVSSKGKLSINPGLRDSLTPEEAMFMLNDGSKLLIPNVSWSKQLQPEGDQAYLDTLNSLTEKGVPVPLRMLAAAGNLNIDELLKQQAEDLELRKTLAKYQEEIAKLSPKGEGGEDDGFSASSVLSDAGRTRAPSILSRDFGSAAELYSLSKTGKKKHIIHQSRANTRINSMIVKALRDVNKKRPKVEVTPILPPLGKSRSPL